MNPVDRAAHDALVKGKRKEYLADPDVLVCSIDQCCTDPDGYVDSEFGTGHRAAQQRRFADEMGVDFGDVSCTRVYIHIYTRQEAWDEHGRERAMDDYGAYDDWLEIMYRDQADRILESRVPKRVPNGWEPPENMPHWYSSKREDMQAIAAWQCEVVHRSK